MAGLLLFTRTASAGGQVYTPLSASVRTILQRNVSDQTEPEPAFGTPYEKNYWLNVMSHRLQKRLPDEKYRIDFLKTVHYEAARAGLDPQLVLALIEVESGFNKYAVSSTQARGYMQVMPFWVKEIGVPQQNLFDLKTNLRYGCVILRYYLVDVENRDLYRALGRYNGSLGKPEYPNLVLRAWRNHWALPVHSAEKDYSLAS
ncbi:MAG TPA: transglycosylase SLT domain-containing protein [Gallionella sp.]|nr:transglycosylase SLT domain-containing protein [Gallionella sp.]